MLDLTAPVALYDPVANANNATITINSQDSVALDANGFPIIANTQLSFSCRIITEERMKVVDVFQEGSDLAGELMWGRLNEPRKFPATFADLSLVSVVFDTGRIGSARIKLRTPHPFLPPQIIGEKFYLLFREG